jgi:hypothetical protein
MDRLHLEVFESPGFSRRVTRLRADQGGKPIEVFHEFDRAIPLSSDTPLDGHVLTVFLYAATLGKPLVVHGAMSEAALRNLEELTLFWNRVRPNLYKRFEIIPSRVVRCASPKKQAAIAAFSGGADGTFTAIRHAVSMHQNKIDTRYPLEAVLMVHGFDVDIYNADDFSRLVDRTRPLIDSLGLDFRLVRTNNRDLRLQNWDDSNSLQLSGCLHMHSAEFQYGLIASSSAYDEVDVNRGSSPITDPLMSGGNFKIVHEGAGYTRTEKVAAIMQHPVARQTLKVCWAGADQAENCGRCEKCVRTQLNILASGTTEPVQCFTEPLDLERIRTMTIASAGQISELSNVLNYARKHNVDAPWVAALQKRVSEWTPAPSSTSLQTTIKDFTAKSLAACGLDERAKKPWRRVRRTVLKKLEGARIGQRIANVLLKLPMGRA